MNIHSVFLNQTEQFYSHKIDRLSCASEYLNFSYMTQRNRLDKWGLWIHLVINDRNDDEPRIYTSSDNKYYLNTEVNHLKLTKTFVNTQEHKAVLRTTNDIQRCTLATDLKSKDFSEKEYVNCPNCGSPNTIGELRNGCSFCGTTFEMTDLFPSVVNYYEHKDFYCSTKDAKTQVGRYFKAYGRVFTLFSEAGKQLGRLSTVGNSNKDYELFMKQYRDDFSFRYFQAEIINILAVCLYSENPSSLPFVKITNKTALIPQLVDFDVETFGIYNKQYSVENGIAKISTILYANAYYAVDGKIVTRPDKYIATFEKDISIPTDYGFSYTKINCDKCGSAFNALKNSICPYCGTKYTLSKESWVITSFIRE